MWFKPHKTKLLKTDVALNHGSSAIFFQHSGDDYLSWQIQDTSKSTYVKCHVKVKDWGILLQHRLSAQRWVDGINMWPNAVLALNHP